MLLTGGIQAAPSTWNAMDIEIQPVFAALLVDADGQPISADEKP